MGTTCYLNSISYPSLILLLVRLFLIPTLEYPFPQVGTWSLFPQVSCNLYTIIFKFLFISASMGAYIEFKTQLCRAGLAVYLLVCLWVHISRWFLPSSVVWALGAWTQVTRFARQVPSPLSHLASPPILFRCLPLQASSPFALSWGWTEWPWTSLLEEQEDSDTMLLQALDPTAGGGQWYHAASRHALPSIAVTRLLTHPRTSSPFQSISFPPKAT